MCSLLTAAACGDSTPKDTGGNSGGDNGGTGGGNSDVKYTLVITSAGDGVTDPAPGSHEYPAGTSVTITATPRSSARFMTWSGDATGQTPPITLVMDGNKAVNAQFSWGKSATSGLPNVPRNGVPKPSGTPGTIKILDWAGFKGAVTYTLDDSQPSQEEHYAELQATGVKMTFFVNEDTASVHLPVWQQMLADGHEIGNHTVDHCHASQTATPQLSGCSFGADQPAAPAQATPASELDDNTAWIKSAIGQSDVWTMATPFGDTGWAPFESSRFLLNRDVYQGFVGPNDGTDPLHLPCFMAGATQDGGIDGQLSTFNDKIDQARTNDKWLIFLFHSILPTTAQWYGMVDIGNITASVNHATSLGDLWTDTMVSVGAYWRAQTLLTPILTTSTSTTWTWTLPAHFPPGKFLRVTVDGGTLTQNGDAVPWDEHGYYEVALDKGTLTLGP
jgi:peptidoglycan/xylan/chitin deacetylase (PgdA/CDA1 family)